MRDLELAKYEMARRGKIVEDLILAESPNLLTLFYTYQNEAIEARKLLESSLAQLEDGSEILEVGGGILALAIQLASEGYRVTTVEPVGEGFSGISNIIDKFLQVMKDENLKIKLLTLPIEECKFENRFNFIFSINVMEHLKDPYLVLGQLVENLKENSKYRFFCPNYDFPYEPHFGKLLYARENKSFYLQAGRANSSTLPAQEISGLFKSLNFVTVRKIISFAKKNNIALKMKTDTSYELLLRSMSDRELAKRHPLLSLLVKFIFIFKLHYISKVIPVKFQPIMDIEASRPIS